MATLDLGRSAGWHGSRPELLPSCRLQREKIQMIIEIDKEQQRREEKSPQSSLRQLIIQRPKLSIFNEDSVLTRRYKTIPKTAYRLSALRVVARRKPSELSFMTSFCTCRGSCGCRSRTWRAPLQTSYGWKGLRHSIQSGYRLP